MAERRCPRVLWPVLAAVVALAGLGEPATAAASPEWRVKARWGNTHLPAFGRAEIEMRVRNVGTSAGAAENLVIANQLPSGARVASFEGGLAGFCKGIGTALATCTIPAASVPAMTPAQGPDFGHFGALPTGFLPRLYIGLLTDPGPPPPGTNIATVSGGGGATATDVKPVVFSSTQAPFGLTPGGFASDLYDRRRPGGDVHRQAGSHPYEYRFDFDFNQRFGIHGPTGEPYTEPTGRLREIEAKLPPGMLGNPEALPKCRAVDFAAVGAVQNATNCPPETQVGVLDIGFSNGTAQHGNVTFQPSMLTRVALYNLEPPPGVPADIGFNAGGFVLGHIYSNLEAERGYAITSLTPHISNLLAVRDLEVTFWGVPGDPAHDSLRYFTGFGADPALGAPFNAPVRPFLTLPTNCGMDNGGTIARVRSYNDPSKFTAPIEWHEPLNVSGCGDQRIRFRPDVDLQPTSRAAGGPTGLSVNLRVAQRDDVVANAAELYDESGDVQAIATPPLKKAVVTLPEGMTISTSAAQGLGSCSPQQIKLGTDDPIACPDSSQYGTVRVHTPLLPKDEPIGGRIFVAQQNDNPFNDLLALYAVFEEPKRGILVKVPGRVQLDPVSGQITTTFDELPQVPVSDLELNLKGGLRAALVNPSTCGAKTIEAKFYSWHDRGTPIVRSSSYEIAAKGDGSPCVNNLGERPFGPRLETGTVSPLAGAYTPFVFRTQRDDDDQELSRIATQLPPGLIARIAGSTRCPEAAIAAAAAPGRTGAEERLNPSCPESSRIGTTQVGSGVGQILTYLGGKVHLAGPYGSAPLSMVVITPVIAGPYDLGTIAVRAGIAVDPVTAQIRIETDPLPQIYQGIPVRLRDIQVTIDRPETTLNPTSCNPMQIAARLNGAGGDVHFVGDDSTVDLAQRFQVTNCAALGFKPRIAFTLRGGTRRGAHPSLRAVLRARPGDANIAATTVTLPKSAFLDQSNIRTICTRVQYAERRCPRASIYGHARAFSPLLDTPLQGPVYMRSSNNRLPDLVASLRGEIDVDVSSRIDSIRGRIRAGFSAIPDAKVSRFVLTMRGGKRGLLQNSRNLCRGKQRALVEMDGHNGKVHDFRPLVRKSCGKGQRRAQKRDAQRHALFRAKAAG